MKPFSYLIPIAIITICCACNKKPDATAVSGLNYSSKMAYSTTLLDSLSLTDTEILLNNSARVNSFNLLSDLCRQKETGVVFSPLAVQYSIGIASSCASESEFPDLIHSFYGDDFSRTEVETYLVKLSENLPRTTYGARLYNVNLLLSDKKKGVSEINSEALNSLSTANGDFSDDRVLKEVNDWASWYTDGYISPLLETIPSGNRISAQGTCLKTTLSDEAARSYTIPFTMANGQVVEKPARAYYRLYDGSDYYRHSGYTRDTDALIIRSELYVDGIELILIQPSDGADKDGAWFQSKWSKLNALHINQGNCIKVAIPEFQIKSSTDFAPFYAKLGIKLPAELSAVYQTSRFSIGEFGILVSSDPNDSGWDLPPVDDPIGFTIDTLTLDSPFYYFLRERTSDTILIAGFYTGD